MSQSLAITIMLTWRTSRMWSYDTKQWIFSRHSYHKKGSNPGCTENNPYIKLGHASF